MANHPMNPGDPLNVDDSHPMTSLNVKSIFAAQTDTLRSHWIHIKGAAWAGEADVKRVEISTLSTDSGTTWQLAKLGQDQAMYRRGYGVMFGRPLSWHEKLLMASL